MWLIINFRKNDAPCVNLTKFNKPKGKVLHMGQGNPWPDLSERCFSCCCPHSGPGKFSDVPPTDLLLGVLLVPVLPAQLPPPTGRRLWSSATNPGIPLPTAGSHQRSYCSLQGHLALWEIVMLWLTTESYTKLKRSRKGMWKKTTMKGKTDKTKKKFAINISPVHTN